MLKDLESYSFLSSSISIIFCMPVVGFAMLIFMLGEGKQRKRVGQTFRPVWLSPQAT